MKKKRKKQKQSAFTVCGQTKGIFPGKWDNCHECIVQIYISDSTYETAKKNNLDMKMLCRSCALRLFPETPDIIELSAQQKVELMSQGIHQSDLLLTKAWEMLKKIDL